MARLYRRTEAGRNAWDTQNAAVPVEYRRVLGLLHEHTSSNEVCEKLGWSQAALGEILEELEQSGMVERLETDGRVDLDFTSSLSVASLGLALNKPA